MRTSLLLVLALAISTGVHAWPQDVYRSMVYDVLLLLPPSLARVLAHRDEALLEGVARLEGETASMLARDGVLEQLSPELVGDVEDRIERAARMVDEHDPFDDIAREFGRLLRIAADLSDPTIVGAGSPELRRVASEYYRFVEQNLSKLPLVHDDTLPSLLDDGADVAQLLERLTRATRTSVAPLSEAFWRNGQLVPASSFDFRSVPYAATSLGYSRGVTAASYLWLSAWARANGDFTGYRYSSKKP